MAKYRHDYRVNAYNCITLPLVSYGGSSLLTTILSLGLVMNIGMRKTKINF